MCPHVVNLFCVPNAVAKNRWLKATGNLVPYKCMRIKVMQGWAVLIMCIVGDISVYGSVEIVPSLVSSAWFTSIWKGVNLDRRFDRVG